MFVQIPMSEVRKNSEDFALMLEWFERVGYDVDIAGLERKSGIRPTNLKCGRQDRGFDMNCRVAAALLVIAVVGPAATGHYPLGLDVLRAEERVDHASYWKIRQEATTNSQILRTAHVLTDLYGPRPTGSPNLKAAGEWAVRQLESWGLQNGRLEPWEWGNPGWLNERLSAHIVSPVKDHLVAEALGWTPGTNGPVTGSSGADHPARPAHERRACRAPRHPEEHREREDRPGRRAPACDRHLQRSCRNAATIAKCCRSSRRRLRRPGPQARLPRHAEAGSRRRIRC